MSMIDIPVSSLFSRLAAWRLLPARRRHFHSLDLDVASERHLRDLGLMDGRGLGSGAWPRCSAIERLMR